MKKSSKQNIRIDYAGFSDVGVVRTENQDSLGQFPLSSLDSYQPGGLLFIVADGMGGHANGQEASQMARIPATVPHLGPASNIWPGSDQRQHAPLPESSRLFVRRFLQRPGGKADREEDDPLPADKIPAGHPR